MSPVQPDKPDTALLPTSSRGSNSVLSHGRGSMLAGSYTPEQETVPSAGTAEQVVPLLIFLHGLGAQAEQFLEQFAHFHPKAHILGLDTLGHGGSGDSAEYAEYTAEALIDRWILLLTRYGDPGVPWVVCGHSYGSILALRLCRALVASRALPSPSGLILLSSPFSDTTGGKRGKQGAGWLLALPDPLIEVLRWMDRRGGTESHSVKRLLGPGASIELKERQLGWNKASRTRTLKRIVAGMPSWEAEEVILEQKGQEDQTQSSIPTLIIVGSEDKVTPPVDGPGHGQGFGGKEGVWTHHWTYGHGRFGTPGDARIG
ncbi:Alpha/Beta hydrolase protein [Piptocephalis cylindrospora]|uniref:Alpha/Beta hydrolase protein n=1 Tax=Piptocephalis cylindrospora TaxID=1907219 RepID=A0A4P9XYS8_9FUNG|nr:Alpha/Beta hydrolase protein [Piptocephalis cylindrospora]|eukprot:RKP11595.1 Alpha/Beta hydrolase protein [Piptocephalis cylindrospora]